MCVCIITASMRARARVHSLEYMVHMSNGRVRTCIMMKLSIAPNPMNGTAFATAKMRSCLALGMGAVSTPSPWAAACASDVAHRALLCIFRYCLSLPCLATSTRRTSRDSDDAGGGGRGTL